MNTMIIFVHAKKTGRVALSSRLLADFLNEIIPRFNTKVKHRKLMDLLI
jgi:hypothetical protein